MKDILLIILNIFLAVNVNEDKDYIAPVPRSNVSMQVFPSCSSDVIGRQGRTRRDSSEVIVTTSLIVIKKQWCWDDMPDKDKDKTGSQSYLQRLLL